MAWWRRLRKHDKHLKEINMPYEMKDGTGSLFKNHKKERETHADYNGSIKVEGQEYWLNAWLKETEGGKKYMSLSAKSKQAKQSSQSDLDDDIRW